jgi:cobalt/nickel transport system permease protein
MLFSPLQMHIPDGFLSALVAVFMWLVTIIVLAIALRYVNRNLGERQVPMMGVLAAAIFAGQMLNFAVAGGTSGHLMGAAIATILLGPWPAVLVMTCVVSIQALIFQDGGLLALGANIFNMAIIGVAVSYMTYQTIRRLLGGKRWAILLGGFLAAWLSVEIAALAVALELALSGTIPANLAIPTMGLVHAVIGVGEGLITVGILAFILSTRPDLIQAGESHQTSSRLVWIFGLLFALTLVILSPLASTHPDGLEWFAEQQGFLRAAQEPFFRIIPDYLLPGISNSQLSTMLAGVLGLLIVLGVVLGMALLRRNRPGSD